MNSYFKHALMSVLLVFGSAAHSQSPTSTGIESKKEHAELIFVYGEDWVDENPELVDLYEACFHTRISYQQELLTDQDKYPVLSSFPLMNRYNESIQEVDYQNFDPEKFIPITYSLPFLSNAKQIIRVDGTDYIIVIEPLKHN